MPGHGVAVAVAALVGKVPGEDDLPPSGRETRQRDRRSTARPAAHPDQLHTHAPEQATSDRLDVNGLRRFSGRKPRSQRMNGTVRERQCEQSQK